MAKRPKMPSTIRLGVYQQDGFACRECGWSPPIPDGYRGHHSIRVVVGERRERVLLKASWTDKPDIYGERVTPIVRSLEVDHINPLSNGGAFKDPANLQTLCSICNNRKGAKV